MCINLLEIGVGMRTGGSFTIRRCFRSVCNNPFLVVIICFFILIYRCCPFVFSLLLSASPVIVCTAFLLGTLLSFGHPEIPKIGMEERTAHKLVSMQMGVSGDVSVVEKRESYSVGSYAKKKGDEMDQLIDRPSLLFGKVDESHEENLLDGNVCSEVRSGEIELETGNVLNSTIEVGATIMKHETERNEESIGDKETVESLYSTIPKMNDVEHLESEDDKSEVDSFDSERVNVDSLDSPPCSPWRRVDDKEEDEDVGDDLESGSDGAESSSPDASVTDIMPMLDEFHPLLDEEVPLPINMSGQGNESDATSEVSRNSSVCSEFDNGIQINEGLDGTNEDNGNSEDDQENREELMSSAITWTEDDQKNLMDLGSSEIERNQRLESLILRRRSRKNRNMIGERNLMDLEDFELGFNVPPISTTRKNPFDANDDFSFTPIPGSAPSVLLPRRSPFDIPYDSSEEKPNLMADGFKEEFTKLQSREPIFRRHESFNVGSSIFAPTRHGKLNVVTRPYFVSKRMVSEELSYSPFQQQSSEPSDLRVSSGSETESIGSDETSDDRKVLEEENPLAILGMKEVSEESQSVDPNLTSTREEISGEDVPWDSRQEMEIVSEHFEHGSLSLEDEEYMKSKEVERNGVDVVEIKFHSGDTQDQDEERIVSKTEDIQVVGYHSNSQDVEQRLSRGSSSSSLSEVSEREFDEVVKDTMQFFEGTIDGVVEEPLISKQTSVGNTDLGFGLVETILQREFVYDSSPITDRKYFTSSSISSDVLVESDQDLLQVFIMQDVTFKERDSHGSSQKEVEENLSRSEDNHLLISEKGFHINASPLDGQLTENHLIDKEETHESPNSDADVCDNANEKLMGNTSHFYDKAMHEQTVQHLNEMNVPNTLVGSSNFREPKTLSIINVEEFEIDHFISANASTTLLSSDFFPILSISEADSPHVEMYKIIEEDDVIKEDIDEELLSELDCVGDFSIKQWGPVSNEIDKHVSSVRDSSLSSEQISPTRDVDAHPKQNAFHSDDPRELISALEDLKSNSELQKLETSLVENVYISNKRDFSCKTDPISVETEDMVVVDASLPVKVDVETTSGTCACKAIILEDSFEQIGNKETSKTNVLDSSPKEFAIEESLFSQSEDVKLPSTSLSLDFSHEEPIREIREVEYSTLDHKLVGSTDNHISPESEDHILHVAISIETQGTTSELKDELTQNVAEKKETFFYKDSIVNDESTIDTIKPDNKVDANSQSAKDQEKKSGSSSSGFSLSEFMD